MDSDEDRIYKMFEGCGKGQSYANYFLFIIKISNNWKVVSSAIYRILLTVAYATRFL